MPTKKPGYARLFQIYNLDRGELILVAVHSLNLGTIHQLNIGHRCLIASTVAALENTDVTTRTLLVPWAQLGEQLAHCRLAASPVESQAAVSHTVILGKGDQRLSIAAQLLGLGQGGLDQFMLNQGHSHIAKHGLAMGAVAV